MDITVKEFLSKAWSKTDGVAIRDCSEGSDQHPEFMAVMTARDSWGDWLVDMFQVSYGIFRTDKVLHLWVYRK